MIELPTTTVTHFLTSKESQAKMTSIAHARQSRHRATRGTRLPEPAEEPDSQEVNGTL
jgi:hypothetical protein